MEQALPKVLGILGGLGPMATVYFYEMLTRHTQAARDQDHIDVIINSRATTPDRTSYILGQSAENPFDIMAADAARLVTFGADVIAIPCNTAHYFYDQLARSLPVPVLNMMQLTVREAKAAGCRKLGILATDGTVQAGSYQHMCGAEGLAWAVPSPHSQAVLMGIIYDQIKQGRRADMRTFAAIERELREAGCQNAVLGCTELSLIKRDEGLGSFFIDSTEMLAKHTLLACGKPITGF